MAWPSTNLGNRFYTSLRKGDSHLKHNSLTSTIPGLTLTRALSPSHTRPWPVCGSLPSTVCFCILTCPYPVTPLSTGSGYFWANRSPYYTPTFLEPSSFYTHLPAYEDGTDSVFRTSAFKIQTPGNYPAESTQHSEHGESLKSEFSCLFACRLLTKQCHTVL